jgi:hypothetical protein
MKDMLESIGITINKTAATAKQSENKNVKQVERDRELTDAAMKNQADMWVNIKGKQVAAPESITVMS